MAKNNCPCSIQSQTKKLPESGHFGPFKQGLGRGRGGVCSWASQNHTFYMPPSHWAEDRGDISSDLYRPQSQDEIVEFSFFVALSYESNLQLGCFWWKISTSSLKTFFYKFCAYFCKSHVQTWELRFSKIYMIEGWWVKKNALSHSHFHYW